ncbi:MAG: metallophosphoesterase family protein [Chitinophagaceae bacterium]|nr:metallophosphoesterase family protein [Chitinophagaceae bacterium]
MSFRRFLQRLLTKPVTRLANRFSSRPNRDRVHLALSKLYAHIKKKPGKKGPVINLNSADQKFIIFSDLHKGNKKRSDDFAPAESNYLAALDHYYGMGYTLIILGDSEELWKYNLFTVRKHNQASFLLEKKFVQQKKLIKIFGNHDVFWNNDPFASLQLEAIYGESVHMYEGLVLKYGSQKKLDIFLTHGHQGDGQSDGNKFSAWFVAKIWAPLQSFLELNINTPAFNDILKTEHNQFMYEWSSAQQDMILITGHTHQPVFESMTHLERLYKQLLIARQQNDQPAIVILQEEIAFRRQEYDHVSDDYLHLKPTYFNTGCCCFTDGDITGIEIEAGEIRLIKWKKEETIAKRSILEKLQLDTIV